MVRENDPVAAQYESWVYPDPVTDMAEAVAHDDYFDLSDPSLYRRKLWPRRIEPESLDILIAGCGANQAAYFALINSDSRVVGVDVSRASLAHQHFLKEKHDLNNLQLHHLGLEQLASLGQTFDLIICTGVLHHLPDPAAGLCRLRDALRPHGVMSLMVYGYHPRAGVYMLQEAFRLLGLQQDAAGVEMIKHTLTRIPPWHAFKSYRAPDLGFDAGLVDTFLHPQDRAYTVPEVLRLVEDGGLQFQAWLDNLDYTMSAYIADQRDPLLQRMQTLPLTDQWRVAELIGQYVARHFFLACHIDRPRADFTLDFSGDDWIDYVPSLRRPIQILTGQEFTSRNAPPKRSTLVKRSFHRVELDTFQGAVLSQIDGVRPVRQILDSSALAEWAAEQRVNLTRDFLRSMANWDHLQYEIP
ncbi:class I SAM-dependent methyltransferase [Geodermatophilus sp. URMC 65]